MKRLSPALTVLYLVVMITVIVSVDSAFLQDHLEWRLIGNIAMVVLFLGGYVGLARLKNK
jgi:hypothetical protein